MRRLSFASLPAAILCSAMLPFAALRAGAQPSQPQSARIGLAWQVQGTWYANDRQIPLRNGDAVEAGSLLRPAGAAPDHSVAILLPDGQRVFNECFIAQDCARGFLVPQLLRAPDPFAVDMLSRVRAELKREGRNAAPAPSLRMPIPRDEMLVALDSSNRAEIGGLAQSLPNGRYMCSAQRIDGGDRQPLRLEVEKSAPRLSVALPGAGTYEIWIRDDRSVLRIDLLVAAETADRAPDLSQQFNRAKALFSQWRQLFHEWPVHELLRAYLQALVLDVEPLKAGEEGAVVKVNEEHRAGVAALPVFLPQPGYQGGDMAVSLQSATEGATIHYMLNGAQPTASSPEYHAPIVVKDLGLTIKAFASAPGMKDSPVVTGTFLIHAGEGP